MGHEIIIYRDSHVLLNDLDLWCLRFFLVVASAELVNRGSSEGSVLKKYFESWEWIGNGVITNLDLSPILEGKVHMELVYLEVLADTKMILESFGEEIPLKYLNENLINGQFTFYNRPPKVVSLTALIEKLEDLLQKPVSS